jgi:cytochrome c553
VELCVACHGEHGVPQDKSIPVIDGQQQGYLYLQGTEPMRGLTASLLN